MASVVFDRLWDEAYEREGELVSHAAALAGVYTIVSAGEALRLARGFADAGRPFFAYCDDAYKVRRDKALERMRRRGQLRTQDLIIIKMLTDKAMKGWW